MRFVGVDLAWGSRGRTGLCLVTDGKAVDSALLQSDDEIVAWLSPYVGEGCLVAIDAPLIISNQTGRRPCEQVISRCFGAQHAAAHSSNLGRPSFAAGVRGDRLARRLDLSIDPAFAPGTVVRRAIEVYPHPALVELFGLDTSLKYKAKRGRSLEARHRAFAALLDYLESLGDADPALDVSVSPRWGALQAGIASDSGAALDRVEDELDAYICAYVALYYWTHGVGRNRVVGDLDTGYIVTPVMARQGACLDREWTAVATGA